MEDCSLLLAATCCRDAFKNNWVKGKGKFTTRAGLLKLQTNCLTCYDKMSTSLCFCMSLRWTASQSYRFRGLQQRPYFGKSLGTNSSRRGGGGGRSLLSSRFYSYCEGPQQRPEPNRYFDRKRTKISWISASH